MRKLLIPCFSLLLLAGCTSEELTQLNADETVVEEPTTRAEGDVFRVRSLTEEVSTTTISFTDWTITPNGTLGCIYSKGYFHHYDAPNDYWPYYCHQTVLNQLLGSPWNITNAMASDEGGNWIFSTDPQWNDADGSRLVKCSSDLSSLVEYTNSLPDNTHILSLATNGSNIILGMGTGNMIDGKYDQLSIYNMSSRRVLTHIADIPLSASMAWPKLYKAKGDILYVATSGCAEYFRVDISTGAVQAFTSRFTPTSVATGTDCEYLYGIEDGKWIMKMRFDQSTDYEVGEIPDYCILSDGSRGTIAEIASMVVNTDGSCFYLNARNREFNEWGAYTYQVYELYGIQ